MVDLCGAEKVLLTPLEAPSTSDAFAPFGTGAQSTFAELHHYGHHHQFASVSAPNVDAMHQEAAHSFGANPFQHTSPAAFHQMFAAAFEQDRQIGVQKYVHTAHNGSTIAFETKAQNAPDESGATTVPLHCCRGCGLEIRERHLLCVHNPKQGGQGLPAEGAPTVPVQEKGAPATAGESADFWHEQCLRCCQCGCQLFGDGSCFVREGRVYCAEDHAKLFTGRRCARCAAPIGPSEYVFRSGPAHVYHVHCFQCSCCGQLLAKGEQYLNVEGQLICQRDFGLMQLHEQLGAGGGAPNGANFPPQIAPTAQQCSAPHSEPSPRFLHIPAFPELDFSTLQRPNFHHNSDRLKKVPKRPRTILNAPQRKAFKVAFEKGPKPSRKVREQLARETGLSVRVVQVWFQNQRAKMKKERKREMDKQQSNGSGGAGGGGQGSVSTNSDSKEDCDQLLLPKSPQSGSELLADDDSDMEDEDSCTSSMGFVGQHVKAMCGGVSGERQMIGGRGAEMGVETPQHSRQNPIEKLYNMHQTYFAFI